MSLSRNEELRAKTLDNNLTWLESFGCRVDRDGEIINVSHKELPEYDARIVVGLSPATMSRFELLLSDLTLDSYVYLDDKFSTDMTRVALSTNGFKRVLVSQVKAARLTLRPASTNIKLTLAQSGDQAQWSALYSEGFARTGKTAKIDRARWQRSFRSTKVFHWFLLQDGRRIGVCQTCICSGVVGIYSFTLRPDYRRVATLIRAARAVLAEIIRRNETIVYFERVKHRVPTRLATLSLAVGFRVIRRFIGYQKAGTGL
jgi:hypothetical protein